MVAETLVLDPVMVATSGDRLLAAEAVDALRTKLIPLASLITPNLPEAAALLNEPRGRRRSRDREPGQAVAGDGMSGGADQGRARAGRREHRLSCHDRGAIALAAPRTPRKTPTAPAAHYLRPSPPAWPKARTWSPRCGTPKPGSPPRSRRPTGSASAVATGRSIISTVLLTVASADVL